MLRKLAALYHPLGLVSAAHMGWLVTCDSYHVNHRSCRRDSPPGSYNSLHEKLLEGSKTHRMYHAETLAYI